MVVEWWDGVVVVGWHGGGMVGWGGGGMVENVVMIGDVVWWKMVECGGG